MKILLYIGAIYHLAFVAFHLSFWKIFNWKYELEYLTTLNQNVMQILNLRLIYIFLVVACLSFFCADELLNENLGKVILFAVTLFWLMRAVEQIIFFGLKNRLSAAIFVVFLLGAGLYGYLCFVSVN